MRRVLRWMRRIALGILGTIVVAIALALLVLHTDWGREKLRARVVASLHAQFPGGVKIGRLEGSVLGDLVLRDVVLNDERGRPAVTAKIVRLNIGYTSLFSGEIEIESLIIDGLTADVVQRPGLDPNVATIYKPSPEPFTWDVALRKVEIHHGRITIDRGDRVDHLDDLELTAVLHLVAEGPVDASIQIGGVLRERGGARLAIAAQAHVDDAGVSVPSASVTIGKASVVATGATYHSLTDLRVALAIDADAGELARLAPELGLPALPIGVKLTVVPAAEPPGSLALHIEGTAAGTTIDGTLTADPLAAKPHVTGTIAMTKIDLSQLGPPLPPSALTATLAVAVELDPAAAGLAAATGHVGIVGSGTVAKLALSTVTADVDVSGGSATFVLHGQGPGGAVVDGRGRLDQDGARLALRDGHVTAAATDLEAATLGVAPVTGRAEAKLDVTGAFGGGAPPALDAHVAIAARGLRHDDLRAGAVDITLDAAGPPDALAGKARVSARGLRMGKDVLPDAIVTARGGMTGPIAVTVDAHDRVRAVTAAIAATVVVGGADPARVADVTLGDYRLAVARAEISGHGGRIIVEDERVIVRDVRATGAGGQLTVDAIAGLGPRAGRLEGKIALTGLDLARARGLPGVPPHAAGLVDLTADLTRRGAAVEGALQASAHGLVITRGARPIDVAASAEIGPKRVELALTADGAELGNLSAAIDVVPPRRLDDPAAWSRLDRRALHAVKVDARALDLARLAQLVGQAPTVEGTLDAAVDLDATHASVQVRGRRIVASGVPAPVDLDLDLDLTDPTTAAVSASATLREIGTASVKTAVALPARPFDLAAWRAIDARSVGGIDVVIEEIAIDAAMARRFGLTGVRGKIAAILHAEPGLREVTAQVTARDVIGGPLVRPAAFRFDASAGAGGTRATAALSLEGATVAELDASAPTTIAELLDGKVDVGALPILATVRIPDTELAPLARALGQDTRLGGRMHGEVKLDGTVAAPSGTVALTIDDLASRIPRGGGAPRGGVRVMTISGGYRDGAILAAVHGRQDDGGTLDITASAQAADLLAGTATISASKFQLAPIARAAPALLLGLRGLLDADLHVRGGNARTARVSGVATLTGGQLPITDTIGNLRDAKLQLSLQGNTARLTVDGSVESGRVSLLATSTLDGVLPRDAKVDIAVKQLSLISSLAPRFDGKLHVDVAKDGPERWKATATLRDAEVTIPEEEGRALHPAGLPPDLVFTSDTRVGVTVPRTRATVLREWLGVRPTVPRLRLSVTIDPVTVVSSQFRGEVAGHLDLAIGEDGASIDGRIGVPRGNVVLFERRYTLRDAGLVFDGSIDPLLEIQLEYDFPQLAMKVVLGGRLSKPTLTLSSNPSTYTEGQLLGFLLGGAPGAAGRETVDAATGVAAALASQVIGGFVTRKLPIRLDVLNYEPTTASSSGAFVFGRWLTSKLLVLVRTRVEARADENVNEAEAEYWLSRRILLQGTAGDSSVLGLDLLWNKRW